MYLLGCVYVCMLRERERLTVRVLDAHQAPSSLPSLASVTVAVWLKTPKSSTETLHSDLTP